MKNKILIILFISVLLLFGTGITYSAFYSKVDIKVEDQKIAKFIFNQEQTDEIKIPLTSLVPGETKDYLFKVSNAGSDTKSNVTINYQLTIRTPHLMPLNIEVYKIENQTDTLLFSCDETYSRNESNELVCNSEEQSMEYTKENTVDYKLKVTFDKNYNTEEYSELIDYIDLDIKSWQKLDDGD